MVRLKHRYLLVQILYPDSAIFKPTDDSVPDRVRFHPPTPDAITHRTVLREISAQIKALFGDYGAGIAGVGLNIKYFSNATSTFILRCPRAHFRLVWASISMMTALTPPGPRDGPGQKNEKLDCVMRVLHVSGTIRKAEEAAIKVARESIQLVTEGASGSLGLFDKLLPQNVVEEEGVAKEGEELEAQDDVSMDDVSLGDDSE